MPACPQTFLLLEIERQCCIDDWCLLRGIERGEEWETRRVRSAFSQGTGTVVMQLDYQDANRASEQNHYTGRGVCAHLMPGWPPLR